METQKIFLITPLGEEHSNERAHADKMWNCVFKPISKENILNDIKCEFVRSDLKQENGESRIREIMNLIRECRGCIVDFYKVDNLNVIYEIGLAHSQGKRVYFLRSDKISANEIPSDIRYYSDFYFLYNAEIFEGEACADEVKKIKEKVIDVAKNMLLGDANTRMYRPFFYQPTEQYVSTVLEQINGKINNLEKLLKDFGTLSEDERTLAQYITGENAAFGALTEEIKKSNLSVKTTRFSPYSVVGRQNTFFNAINNIMSRDVHPKTFERIIAANNVEKFNEVAKLMANNAGKDFKIYVSVIEYSFEMVIIDDEIVFIHFRKYNTDANKESDTSSVALITATLRIEKRLIANEFSTIFDSIVNNSKDIEYVIDCKEITTENLGQKIEEYKEKFNSAVNKYKAALK